MLVTEYCAGGSMDAFLKTHAISARKLLLFASDIAAGLAHLHAHGVVHRDLAARNLLLSKKPRVLKGTCVYSVMMTRRTLTSTFSTVCDFGLARQITDSNTTKSAGGPVKWQPPETIVDGVYSRASDVWSFGVVVWEIAARRRPFDDLAPGTAAVAICKGTRLYVAILLSHCWCYCCSLINCCCCCCCCL
jgi:serine/threonine protein kinase